MADAKEDVAQEAAAKNMMSFLFDHLGSLMVKMSTSCAWDHGLNRNKVILVT